jgi:hypothetical protein
MTALGIVVFAVGPRAAPRAAFIAMSEKRI